MRHIFLLRKRTHKMYLESSIFIWKVFAFFYLIFPQNRDSGSSDELTPSIFWKKEKQYKPIYTEVTLYIKWDVRGKFISWTCYSVPGVIKLFSCSTQLSIQF